MNQNPFTTLLVLATSLGASLEAAAQVYVNKGATEIPRDGSTCERGLETIQQGIEKAGEGGTVIVCDSSTYQESIVLKDGQTVQSAALPAAFTVETVEQLCRRGGLPTIQATSGSAITTQGLKKPVTIQGFRVFGGSSSSGGGIRADQVHSIQIIGCCVEFNHAGSLGGGIAFASCQTARIDRCLVAFNSSNGRGGGIGAEVVKQLDIDASIIRGNVASTDGAGVAGISVKHSTTTSTRIEFNVCDDGSGGRGGGEFYQDSEKLKRRNNRAFRNTSDDFGGAAHFDSVAEGVAIENYEFEECESRRRGGGAISFDECGKSSIAKSKFIKNKCGFGEDVGELDIGFSRKSGGALHLEETETTIDDCEFKGNEARLDGGAIVALGDLSVEVLSVLGPKLKMTKVTFEGNVAHDDGGAISATVSARLSGDSLVFKNKNIAKGNGGALHVSCTASAQLRNCVFEENEAGLDGGAIYLRNSALDSAGKKTVFVKNKSGGHGGAVYGRTNKDPLLAGGFVCNDHDLSLLLTEATLRENVAGKKGAVAVERPAEVRSILFKLSDLTFVANVGSDADAVSGLFLSLGDEPETVLSQSFIRKCSFDGAGRQVMASDTKNIVNPKEEEKDKLWVAKDCSFALGEGRTGLFLTRHSPDIVTCTFTGKEKKGLGVVASSATALFVEKSSFTECNVGVDCANVTGAIEKCSFLRNHIGIRLVASTVTLTKNTFGAGPDKNDTDVVGP